MVQLDMGRAWDDAVALLSKNRDLIAVVAGVFFFLPQFALMLFLPQEMAKIQAGAGNANPEKMMEMLSGFYAQYWWVFLLVALISAIGTLALMALLTDRSRPTLGEALKVGLGFLPSYIAVQLLVGLALGAVIVLPVALAAATGLQALAAVIILIVLVVALWAFLRLTMTTPVIGVERVTNPVEAIKRAWRMTKGNSLRLLGFFALLAVALFVAGIVLTLFTGMLFGLMGAEAAMIGNGFVSAILQAVWASLFAAVLVAVHRQLSGWKNASDVAETFD